MAQYFSARQTPSFVLSEEKLDPNRSAIKQAKVDWQVLHGGSGDRGMAYALIEHRSQIYRQELIPRLKKNISVIANRGLPATLAYQTLSGDINMFNIWDLHRSYQIPFPELIIITHCSVDSAEKRELSRPQTPSTGLSGQVTPKPSVSPEENRHRRQAIHQNYQEVIKFIRGQWFHLYSPQPRVMNLDTDQLTLAEELDIVVRNL